MKTKITIVCLGLCLLVAILVYAKDEEVVQDKMPGFPIYSVLVSFPHEAWGQVYSEIAEIIGQGITSVNLNWTKGLAGNMPLIRMEKEGKE